MRTTGLRWYMEQAVAVAKRSHDAETQVGSLLVKESSGAVIASSFNGFVRGCDDSLLPNTRPEKYEYVQHSEQNLLANCVRHSIGTEGAYVICTLTPCVACTRMLWQAGITRVIAASKYRDFPATLAMKDLRVVEISTPEGFTELHYFPAKGPDPRV